MHLDTNGVALIDHTFQQIGGAQHYDLIKIFEDLYFNIHFKYGFLVLAFQKVNVYYL